MRARTLALTLVAFTVSLSGVAEAHFNLMTPPPASTSLGGGKGAPPCGPLTPASNVVTAIQGGHPLMVTVNETINHGGFYRLALSVNSRTELPVDNVVYDAAGKVLPPSGTPSGTSARADSQTTPVFPVLADNLWPHAQSAAPKMYSTSIMIPNLTCAKCTLQVIEFMAPHGFNDGGGYFYHHCADLKITADPALPLFGAATDGGAADVSADAVAPAEVAVDMSGTGTGGSSPAGSGGAGGAAPSGSGGVSGTGGAGTGGAGTGGKGSDGGGGGGGGCAIAGGRDLEIGFVSFGMIAVATVVAFRRRARSRS
jgi:hypothetical protein